MSNCEQWTGKEPFFPPVSKQLGWSLISAPGYHGDASSINTQERLLSASLLVIALTSPPLFPTRAPLLLLGWGVGGRGEHGSAGSPSLCSHSLLYTPPPLKLRFLPPPLADNSFPHPPGKDSTAPSPQDPEGSWMESQNLSCKR